MQDFFHQQYGHYRNLNKTLVETSQNYTRMVETRFQSSGFCSTLLYRVSSSSVIFFTYSFLLQNSCNHGMRFFFLFFKVVVEEKRLANTLQLSTSEFFSNQQKKRSRQTRKEQLLEAVSKAQEQLKDLDRLKMRGVFNGRMVFEF